ncbi:hypothetical protein Anae109_3843 [Anaeromyxobacter sp. Fw109-5]|nr:hypothetical protein Anae109_3843 [Anaeromyxobacter sp. Fw109-5]
MRARSADGDIHPCPCNLQRQLLRATRVPVAVGERCPLDEVRGETRFDVLGTSRARSSRAQAGRAVRVRRAAWTAKGRARKAAQARSWCVSLS